MDKERTEESGMSPSPEESVAANEIRKFRRMFRAVFDLGEGLENASLLTQTIAERERKLATLASEEEGILAARQERISAAEMKLSQLEGRITGCQEEAGVLEDSLSRRRAEVEIEFQKIDSNVRERQRKLSEVEDRLAAIRSAI